MQGTFLKLNKTRPFQLSSCVCVYVCVRESVRVGQMCVWVCVGLGCWRVCI